MERRKSPIGYISVRLYEHFERRYHVCLSYGLSVCHQ